MLLLLLLLLLCLVLLVLLLLLLLCLVLLLLLLLLLLCLVLLLLLLVLLLWLLLLLLVLLRLRRRWWRTRWPLWRLLVLCSLRGPSPLSLGVHEASSGVSISVGRRGFGSNRIRGLCTALSTSDLGVGSRGCGLCRWAPPRWTWSTCIGSPGRRRCRQR